MWYRFKTWWRGRRGTPEEPPKGLSPEPSPQSAAGEAATRGAGDPRLSGAQDAAAPQGEAPLSGEQLAACYRELGAPEGADLNTVRRAWKAALKKVHMDHYADDPEVQTRARDRTQRLNEAYRILREKLF
ncbi:MAG: J domain-containing protein [Nitrospinaceae bacterium]